MCMVWGDSKPVKPSTKNSPKLYVWGAFSARETFSIKIFRENLTNDYTVTFYANV